MTPPKAALGWVTELPKWGVNLEGDDSLLNIKAFRAEVKKRLFEKDWTYEDLAKTTGYRTRTIEVFMGKCHDKCRDPSVKVAEAIAKALDIPEYMAQ